MSTGDEDERSISFVGDNDEIVRINLMTLRKPTELKKIMDSVPKPDRAVPKNGLPLWYKLDLDSKLPVPDMPKGKIVFSRGKVGEDIRKPAIEGDRPSFMLTDLNTTYPYVEMHDPHLNHHFAQKPIRDRMKQLGFVTEDGRATCSLKEFNSYRKFLYRIYMDRIHEVMKKVDENARDDLVLRRVEWDVARRALQFKKSERTRELLEKAAQLDAHETAERNRLAKEQEKKAKDRIRNLIEFNEKQRRDRAAKSREKENRIKQRVLAAAELEIRRKITMMRQWRINEKRRLYRIKKLRDEKARRLENEANRKWEERVNAQNSKIENNMTLLNIYSEDMTAAARRRLKRSQIKAYETDLELQRIRLANLKLIHGGHAKAQALVKKMGTAFEKATRGAKGMCMEVAQQSAKEAMSKAVSVQSDRYICLGQARIMMDATIQLPSAPVKIFEQMMENAVMEFTRRMINRVLRGVEASVREEAAVQFFNEKRPTKTKKTKRWGRKEKPTAPPSPKISHPIIFGAIEVFDSQFPPNPDVHWKSVHNRPPTPVPSKTDLVELTFLDRADDLPDPVAIGKHMPERNKLLDSVDMVNKVLMKSVKHRVNTGMDLMIYQVTLPSIRHTMEWGEAVESLATAAVDDRINADCGDVRRASEYLAYRILKSLNREMKERKKKAKEMAHELQLKQQNFYNPDVVLIDN